MFEKDELKIVGKEIPSLTGILNLEVTREILRNPKYLDLAVQMAEQEPFDTQKPISEPVLIRGFWDLLNDGGSNPKQTFLAELAVSQADKSDFCSSTKCLSHPEHQLIEVLTQDGVLKVQDNYIRFSHDLYGDWIRQRFLLSNRPNIIKEISERKENVYWHQSIKLTSLDILETEGFDKWRNNIELLHRSGGDVLVDLFLDVAITPINQYSILEAIKEFLLFDDCKWLCRFLERFLFYATAPNPKYQ